MSRLTKLTGQPVKVEIEGEEYNIYPLTVADTGKLREDSTMEEKEAYTTEIFLKSMKDEELTEEDMNKIPIRVFQKLSDEIAIVNGFAKDESGINKIKEKIAKQGGQQ